MSSSAGRLASRQRVLTARTERAVAMAGESDQPSTASIRTSAGPGKGCGGLSPPTGRPKEGTGARPIRWQRWPRACPNSGFECPWWRYLGGVDVKPGNWCCSRTAQNVGESTKTARRAGTQRCAMCS